MRHDYTERFVPYYDSVQRSQVAGAIATAAEPVDWGVAAGATFCVGRDACYGAKVRLLRETGKLADGTPNLAYRGAMPALDVAVSALACRCTWMSTCPGHRRFVAPVTLELEVDWLRQ